MSRRSSRLAFLSTFAAVSVASFSFAQTPVRPTPPSGASVREITARGALRAGKPAPAFKVEKFLKGDPITSLEKGKIYVIECWATWCGPCISAMPHLSQLQRELRDKGVTIIGVSVNEDRGNPDAGDLLPVVERFVAERGYSMDYTVAFDGQSKQVVKSWITPTGLKGIPMSFVVDREGTIAWIGHPLDLDLVLDEVIAGTWDVETGESRVATAKRDLADALNEYSRGVDKGDAAWDKLAATYPAFARAKQVNRVDAMLKAGLFDRAFALANAITDAAIAGGNDATLNTLFQRLLPRGQKPSQIDGPLLLRISQAYGEIIAKSGDTSAAKMMLFRAYLATGETERAAQVKKETLEAASPEQRQRLESMFRAFEGSGDGRPRGAQPAPPSGDAPTTR